MSAHVLVLNAGSSSLKFSVFRSSDGQLDTRGQIEGIGTAPRLAVKDGRGEKLADDKLDASVRDARAAIEVLSGWLRSRYQGGRIAGVGHRVVHGGPRYSVPVLLSREILAELKGLAPLAPLHQIHYEGMKNTRDGGSRRLELRRDHSSSNELNGGTLVIQKPARPPCWSTSM